MCLMTVDPTKHKLSAVSDAARSTTPLPRGAKLIFIHSPTRALHIGLGDEWPRRRCMFEAARSHNPTMMDVRLYRRKSTRLLL